MGIVLSITQFHELANRIRNAGITFIIEPHLRFINQPGEQYTMFFKDPSGTLLFLFMFHLMFSNLMIHRTYSFFLYN